MISMRITDKGNVVVDGVKYKAVPTAHGTCTGCVFSAAPCASMPCDADDRIDIRWKHRNQHVVFIKKGPKL